MLLLATAASSLACAQTPGYPTKPVTVVVPFSPGGGTDIGARLIAQKLTARWGQSVIVEATPADLQAIINRDRARYGKVIADRGIKVE